MTNMYFEDGDGFLVDNSVSIVDAGLSDSGNYYLCFEQCGKRRWIDRNLFAPDPMPGIHALKTRGITIFLSSQRTDISKHISERTLFRPIDILEHPGWNGLRFGWHDGTAIPASADEIPVAYQTGMVNVSARGTYLTWRRHVANFVKEQHLPFFCIMMSFAAPLLRFSRIQGNFAFMLSGPPRKGKTTCLDVAASVCGPALDAPGGRYYLKFNNTMNRLEQLMRQYADLPFIIDELSSHGNKTSRMTDFRTLVHYFAGVDARGRYGDEEAPAVQTKTIILITSNDSMRELLAHEEPDAAEAVADRMIELPVERDDEGAFNELPPGFIDPHGYAEEVRARVGQHYGTAMPQFLRGITAQREEDDAGFADRIHRHMEEFAVLPTVQAVGPVSSRVIDAFALVYAAGLAAQNVGVLPRSADCQAAALHCLRLHLGLRAEADPVQRLLRWMEATDLIDLRQGSLPVLSDETLREHGAFIGECRGVAQLWIAPRLFARVFAEAGPFLQSLETRKLLKIEGKGDSKHRTIKCAVQPTGPRPRLHVVTLPDLDQWLEEHGYPRGRKSRR